MADDPSDCNEAAMEILLNLLRSSQSTCTDNQCMSRLPGPQGSPADGGYNMMLFLIVSLVIVIALYLLRPAGLRRNREDHKNKSGARHDPPAPPDLH